MRERERNRIHPFRRRGLTGDSRRVYTCKGIAWLTNWRKFGQSSPRIWATIDHTNRSRFVVFCLVRFYWKWHARIDWKFFFYVLGGFLGKKVRLRSSSFLDLVASGSREIDRKVLQNRLRGSNVINGEWQWPRSLALMEWSCVGKVRWPRGS